MHPQTLQVTITRLWPRRRGGDRDALDHLYRRFAPKMLLLAQHLVRCDPRLRAHYDKQDLAQSVWASILAHNRLDQPFGGPDQFMVFLEMLIRRKARKTGRYLGQQKRDCRRVVSFATLQEAVQALTDDRQRSPVVVAIADEDWRRLLEANTPPQQQILRRRREGFALAEIATEMFLSERTVRRLLDRVDVLV